MSTFELYDLKIEVIAPPNGQQILCSSKAGDYVELKGEVLSFPPNQGFSIYSLATLLPLLPAKQRAMSKADWMSREDVIACPDPMCKSTMLITRTAISSWEQGEDGVLRCLGRKEL